MTKIKFAEIKYLANLSQVKLSKDELFKFGPQLSKVIEYVSELNNVDTKNTEPTNQTTGLINITSPDITSPSLKSSDVVGQSRNIHKGFFNVPITIKNRSI